MMDILPVLYLLLVCVLLYSGYYCSTTPCSTSVNDICSRRITVEPVNSPFLLRVTTMQPCECVLSVLNSDSDVTSIYFSSYLSLASSSPRQFSCGVGLRFGNYGATIQNIFWDIQCIFENSRQFLLQKDHSIIIESFIINGTLRPEKGYCIEISSDINQGTNQKLQLECGVRLVSSSVILLTTKASLTTSTSVMQENSFQHNKQSTEDNKTTIAIGGSIGGLVLVVLVIFIFVFRKKMFRKEVIYEDQKVRTFIAEESQYDDLSHPSNSSIYEIQ